MYPIRVLISAGSGVGSKPSTLMRPDVGSSKPARSRMRVVLPAPSGPTNPVIIPASTWAFSWSIAALVRKVFTRPAISINTLFPLFAGFIVFIQQLHRDRHTLTNVAIWFFQDHAKPVDQIGTQFAGFHVFWSELGDRRNKSDLSRVRMIRVSIVVDQRFHTRIDATEVAFVDVGSDPNWRCLTNRVNDGAGGNNRARLHCSRDHYPVDRRA